MGLVAHFLGELIRFRFDVLNCASLEVTLISRTIIGEMERDLPCRMLIQGASRVRQRGFL